MGWKFGPGGGVLALLHGKKEFKCGYANKFKRYVTPLVRPFTKRYIT